LERPPWPERPSLRFLVHMSLREAELCPGPEACPEAPEPARGFEGRIVCADRCRGCPLDALDAAMRSHAGQILRRALDLDAALRCGIGVPYGEWGAEEFRALKVLRSERDRWEKEQEEARRREADGLARIGP